MTVITDTEIRPLRIGIPEPERRHSIEAEGLRKEFPGGVLAVAGIDLDIHEGEIFGFLGPNGAGKTTTLRMLTTLLRPTAGRQPLPGSTSIVRRTRFGARSALLCRRRGST